MRRFRVGVPPVFVVVVVGEERPRAFPGGPAALEALPSAAAPVPGLGRENGNKIRPKRAAVAPRFCFCLG